MLPEISHLQFAVLDALGASEMSGEELRVQLKERRAIPFKTLPAFYQLMSRLEDAKFVKGWYVDHVVDGQRVRRRFYKLLAEGRRTRDQALSFYAQGEGSASYV